MAAYRLGTFSAADGEPFAGLVVGERVIDLRGALERSASVLDLIEGWESRRPELEQIAAAARDDEGTPLTALDVLAPIAPRQILCAGANYRRHVVEMAFAHLRRADPSRGEEELHAAAEQEAVELAGRDPFLFVGLPTAICGPHDDIVLRGPGHEHDWEAELAVVVGRGGRDIEPAAAMDHVAGYTVANDITTRDVLNRGYLPMSDFVTAKNRPTFFPLGPWIVPKEAIADPGSLRVTLTVNGEVMQDDEVSDMVHGIGRLIAYASRTVDLLPGDLLLTGSPAGNAGHHGGRWLRPGDVVETAISDIGVLRNRCVGENGDAAAGQTHI